ncbi:uncharacterized protein LOC128266018 [Drosophila gunungcola]|uniref:uncharacterized protein LOC128266018 n=1 Tax=Drosophila gunungcola TaxID=103775 RepID=UPI0022E328B9|nr:uncharacterized protein LOC128266018 [Drosophila gunungcola]
MPGGDDKKNVSASPLSKTKSTLSPLATKSSKSPPSIVVKPATPKTPSSLSPNAKPATSSSRVTRSIQKMASTAYELALNKFIAVSDRLSDLESRNNTPGNETPSVSMLQIRREQVRVLWDKVEKEFDVCSECITAAGEDAASTLPILKSKYNYCYTVYERYAAQLTDIIQQGTAPPAQAQAPAQNYISSGCRLPPCDTEVFSGDYLRWPTFRVLFTAIYINNPRLTPVEKLFHLNAKTSGDAHAIIANSPLTNDGFRSAWDNLTERFDNKRLLVNSQFKILFNLQSISQESGAALKELQTTIQGCLNALELSGILITDWDCILVYMCSSKLPKLTLSLWEQSLHDKAAIPKWVDLNTFLTERHRTLEAIDDVRPSGSSHSQSKATNANGSLSRINSYETKVVPKPRRCDLCSRESHPIRTCPRFLQMTVDERAAYIRNKQMCLNCFARGHQLRDCTSTHSCFTCRSRHHTQLHRSNPFASPPSRPDVPMSRPATSTEGSAASDDQSGVQVCFASGARLVLLGTAIINICHLGSNFQARALIDSGFEATFVTERLFNLFKLPFQVVQAQVSGLNQTVSAQSKKLCHFTIRSPSRPALQLETSADVLPQLAGNLPSYPIPQDFLRNLPDLPLADPKFYESAQIDVLIGADILPSVLLNGAKTNICGSLLGQETIFGVHNGLDKILTKFWEVEDLPIKLVKESDSVCEDNFSERPREMRTADTSNEQRLKRDIPLKIRYDSVIQEYLDLNHMREVFPTHDFASYYLPHHAVLKPESITTKLRLVFNASSPSANGASLNDILHAGQVLQSDLTIQILKWRYFQYVFSADIEKMYRQIWVDPKHTPFQRILFRNPDGDIREFELKTVTFGVNCAPYLTIRVLQQLATDVQHSHPKAKLQSALNSAGFPLRKLTSNHKDILAHIPSDHLLRSDFLEIDAESTAKTLGVRWKATSDKYFFVPPELSDESSLTKRQVLSQIAKLFDPAGWLAPFVMRAKIFMQEIWLQDLGWDDELPSGSPSDQNSESSITVFVTRLKRHTVLRSMYEWKWGIRLWCTFSLQRRELRRVTKITQSAKAEKWSHVQSEHNPADLASRGVALQELVDNPLWWHGPA